MARDPIRELSEQIAALKMNDSFNESARATQNLVDPITRLGINTGDLKNVQEDNISEVRYLRNTLLQQNNVANKLLTATKKADSINVKALSNSVTLQKVIDKNSDAVLNSNVGYLRSAEAFIENFGAGIRRTEGGTLRLTEQLILTGQELQTFRDVNKTLLGATGRNYDAIEEFNDAVVDTADVYQISTGKLLEGIQRLQQDINQFALFGPQVAGKLTKVFTDVKGSLQGLGDAQVASFMKLGQGGLATRPTRELLGIQDFFQNMSTGNITADEARSQMVSVGEQIADLTRGQEFDVAISTIEAMFKVSQQDAANLVMLKDIVNVGATFDRDLLATTEDQKKTLENQAQLANKYYEQIAPATLNAATASLATLMQIAQGVNLFAAAQGGTRSLLNLAGGPGPGGKGKMFTPMAPPNLMHTQQHINNTLKAQIKTQVKSTNSLLAPLKNIARSVRDQAPGSIGSFLQSPMGFAALSMAAQAAVGAVGADSKTGQVLAAAQTPLMAGAVARGLVPGIKPALSAGRLAAGGIGFGIGGALLDITKDPLLNALGKTEGEGADLGDTIDIASQALTGAGIGFTAFGPIGAAVGGALGAGIGLIGELMEEDGKTSKEQLAIQREQQARERAAEARDRANIQRSDFVLTGLAKVAQDLYRTQQMSSEKLERIMERVAEGLDLGNRDRRAIAAEKKKGDMND